MPITDSYSPLCPICGIELNWEGRRQFDCPGCGNTLVVAESRTYRVFRALGIVGTASAWAWRSGWELSFIVFVVSFYIFPILFFWAALEAGIRHFFPPKLFEPKRKYLKVYSGLGADIVYGIITLKMPPARFRGVTR
jgi:predicted RNA-binding Zn-ribbon protein involved in translation (DUF1610 family)